MTSSKILFYLCVAFIAGIFLQSCVKSPQILVWAFLILGALLLIIFGLFARSKSSAVFCIAGFCLLFFALGILRMQISEFNIANNKLSALNDKGEIILEGIILAEPDERDTHQKIKVKIYNSLVLINTNLYPKYKYLDKIKIIGKLETPQETEDFSYKNYLMKDGIYSVMNFPKIEKLGNAKPNFLQLIYSGILQTKQKIRESIRNNFSPPESSILEGTVLGDNGAMDNDLKNKLNITGLRHVIAVSGTHVVILSSIIMSLLLALGLNRGKAFYFALAFIFLYIVLTGLPASGVRAGIMGGLYLSAQKLGRQSMGSRVIATACCCMLAINPLLLFYDVGFQLSFLAVIGLIYLGPVFNGFIKVFTKDKAQNLVEIISTTFAAQVFTLPVMIYNFGNLSFISPLTNILVLPIVYWLMIFGFLSSFLGIFWQGLGWIFALPSHFLLSYFVWVIDFFSKSWAIKTFENVSWIWVAIAYLIIIVSTRFLHKKYRQNFI
jgi:competence protein ComEC